jgi:branched-chain amino acid transport system permease protein
MDLDLLIGIFPQVLLDGITLGFMYALIALGYTMVYGVLEFINFAHSEIFILGSFVGAVGAPGLWRHGDVVALLPVPAPHDRERAPGGGRASRTARSATPEADSISAISQLLPPGRIRLFESLAQLLQPRLPVDGRHERAFELTPTIDIPSSPVVIGACPHALDCTLVNRTKIGKAIRAVAEDQAAASLMGINVNRMISLTFLIGGAMGGGAGVLFGVQYSLINPYTGFIPGLKAFTAAVLGGIGNIPGAMLGGLVLGLLEAFAASYLSLLTAAFGAEYMTSSPSRS